MRIRSSKLQSLRKTAASIAFANLIGLDVNYFPATPEHPALFAIAGDKPPSRLVDAVRAYVAGDTSIDAVTKRRVERLAEKILRQLTENYRTTVHNFKSQLTRPARRRRPTEPLRRLDRPLPRPNRR